MQVATKGGTHKGAGTSLDHGVLNLDDENFDFWIETHQYGSATIVRDALAAAKAQGYVPMPFAECPPEFLGDRVRYYLVPEEPVEREDIL